MADLDDFFAKKDRKKNKGKKFTTADEIAKKLEETGKKIERTKKEKPVQPPSTPGQEGEEQIIVVPEDEWKEFEEEKKDYTGLKIGNLQITEGQNADGDGDGEDEGAMEENEAGEMVLRKKVVAGPWKMVNAQQQGEVQPIKVTPVAAKRPEVSGSTSYVPPHFRGGGPPKESSHGHSANTRMKNRAAPDINNQEYFPTLSGGKTNEPAGAWGKKRRDEGTFEEVRNSKGSHYGRGYADVATKTVAPSMTGPKLNLGNKYDALDDGDQS